MSNLKNCFMNGVSMIKRSFAYVRVVPVLIGAIVKRIRGNGFYEVEFRKLGRKWYCNVPGFPEELFEHTLMVGGAAKFLEYYSRGETQLKVTIKVADAEEAKWHCGSQLQKNSSTLTGGAFYNDANGYFTEEFWLCPVTQLRDWYRWYVCRMPSAGREGWQVSYWFSNGGRTERVG